MTWPQQSWGHTAWVMLPRSCTEVKWIEVKWIEVKWCRYLWLSSGNWGQWVSLSREVNLSLSLRSNIGQNEVKSGRFSTNWWGLVSLVPEQKSKFRVLNHLTATPAWRFHYFSVVHDAKCITLCQNCIFSCSFFREMCVARDKLLCICFWESLFSVARLQTFLIGPWPWALILVIMT